jgi:uncharacterized protein YbjT (DUF2867 family)
VIVLAGGTGRLGTLLATRLAARGVALRILTRDPARASHLVGLGAEILEGDVRNRASLDSAVRGAATVVSAIQGFEGPGRISPASVDRDGNANLIDASAAVGAHVVLVSVVGAAPDHEMELFRAKWAAEQHLRDSGVPWTIVRATAFVELWMEIMTKPIVFGRGENPINFVSVGDVAAVTERAVDDADLRGKILEVGGPENTTFNELAALLLQLRGQSAAIRHIPRRMLRAGAPFSRRARAALAMDNIDMTFDAAPARRAFAEIPTTEIRTALTQALG